MSINEQIKENITHARESSLNSCYDDARVYYEGALSKISQRIRELRTNHLEREKYIQMREQILNESNSIKMISAKIQQFKAMKPMPQVRRSYQPPAVSRFDEPVKYEPPRRNDLRRAPDPYHRDPDVWAPPPPKPQRAAAPKKAPPRNAPSRGNNYEMPRYDRVKSKVDHKRALNVFQKNE